MSPNDLFEKFDLKINDLYTFRDKYYILNTSSTNPDDRTSDLSVKLEALVAEIESESNNFESKALYLILLGKAYNVMPDFSEKSTELLTKCVKLDPNQIEAWNFLGECYWKKRDFQMCKNCFEQSLKLKKNKMALRGLSMVMRQLINLEPKNSKTFLDESIRFAKESLQLDFKDGMSWYILANCYVSLFFSPFGQQNASILKQAVSAYTQALRDESIAQLQTDLYYNKSMISMYEENWPDVLICLTKALNLDPHWIELKDNLKGTINYLFKIEEMISTKGKLKSKKFQALIEGIQKSDLGPYAEGFRTEKEKVDLVQCNLKDLQPGLNQNKVLVGKVICTLQAKTNSENLNIICFSCCIADSNGDCAAMTIYNLVESEGVIIGNSVAIPEPWLERVDFKFNLAENLKNDHLVKQISDKVEYEFKFDSIRVENPTVLVVKGKKWGKEKISSAFFVPKVVQD